jgi:hypothetical protein
MKIKDSYDMFRAHTCPPPLPNTQSLLRFQWQIEVNSSSLENTYTSDNKQTAVSLKSRLQDVYQQFSSTMKLGTGISTNTNMYQPY